MSTQPDTIQAEEATSLPTVVDPTITDAPAKPKKLEPKKPEPKLEQKPDDPASDQQPSALKANGKPLSGQQQNNIALQKLKSAADIEAYQWISQIAGETEIQVAVNRKEPEWFKDPVSGEKVKVNGTVATYNRTFTEKEIQDKHGGGSYQYVIKTKSPQGRWEYFGAKTVEIAGDPNIEDIPRTRAPVGHGQPHVIQQAPADTKAMDALIGIMGQQLNRPAPLQQGPSGADIAAMIERAVATATAPLMSTITAMTTQLELKDKALEQARNAPPDAFRDMMMKSIMSEQDGRITALRASHESEMRMLKENAREDEKRWRDEWNRERDRIEKAHERELAAIKLAHDAASISSKGMADITKTVLEAENKRYVAELAEARSDLKELRAIKNPSLKDKVDELESIKELIGDGGEDKGTLAQIMEVVGNLPVMATLADKLTGGGEKAAVVKQQQQVQQRPRLVKDSATGEVFKLTAEGKVPLKRKGTEVTNEGGQKIEIPPIDPEMLKMAVLYMENAYRNNTEPKTFADGARPQIGPSILHAIRQLGVTEFFVKVVRLDPASPLMTMSGRNWSKKVATFLLQGAGDIDEPPPIVTEPPAA